VGAIVPPQRRIMRRRKAYLLWRLGLSLALLALGSFGSAAELGVAASGWARLVGLSCGVLAAIAFVGAIVFRIVEPPREVVVHRFSKWPVEPPVIHLDRRD
jgi:hypothetical protein